MKNKILCPTPVSSLPFHPSDLSSFVSFYSRVKQASLYFDCNPNGRWEHAERSWEKKRTREREIGDKMAETGVGLNRRQEKKKVMKKKADQRLLKSPQRLKIVCVCVCVCCKKRAAHYSVTVWGEAFVTAGEGGRLQPGRAVGDGRLG